MDFELESFPERLQKANTNAGEVLDSLLVHITFLTEQMDSLEEQRAAAVAVAREVGIGWRPLGIALGISHMAARRRYAATEDLRN